MVTSSLVLFKSLVKLSLEIFWATITPCPLDDFANLDEEFETARRWGTICPSLQIITLPLSMHLFRSSSTLNDPELCIICSRNGMASLLSCWRCSLPTGYYKQE